MLSKGASSSCWCPIITSSAVVIDSQVYPVGNPSVGIRKDINFDIRNLAILSFLGDVTKALPYVSAL